MTDKTKKEDEETIDLSENPDYNGNGNGDVVMVKAADAEGTTGQVLFEDAMSKNYLVYAWSTLLDRALPQIDGLLPVQRRVILAMDKDHLTPKAKFKKSSYIVGQTMGTFHPHGDLSIYGALARMSQVFSLRLPLVDGQGQFGSIDGDSPAAMRYTEARMTPAAEDMIKDLDKEILPDFMGRNYDESTDEPSMLPTRFPNLLINGAYGIATGMTSLFVPHNPGESIDLCSWRLKNPDATIKQAVKRISGPDFPTGGTVVNDQGLQDMYLKGKGRVTGLAKAHIEKGDKGRDKIIITELPWMVQKGGDSGILKKMGVQYGEGKYPEFDSLNDFSDKNGLKIEIGLKRGVNTSAVLQKLLKNTSLRKTYGVEMNCVVNGAPKTINLLELIDLFLDFRRYVVIKRAEKRIQEIEVRLHKLDAYMKVIGATDKVVQIIKKSEDRAAAKPPLKKLLKIDEEQAQLIVEMQLGSLTQLDSYKIEEEVKNLTKELKELQKFIKTPDLVTDEMIEEFQDIKGTWKKAGLLERRTSLTEPVAEGEDDSGIDDVLTSTDPSEDCTLMISASGRAICSTGTLKRGGSLKLAEGDKLVVIEPARTNDEFLVFSDQMKAYRLRLAELEKVGRKVPGDRLSTILGIGTSERVVAAIPLRRSVMTDDKETTIETKLDDDIFFVTENGMIKRTLIGDFAKTNSAGIAAGKLGTGDGLVSAIHNPLGDKGEMLLLAKHGKLLRFSTSVSRVMGRAAGGVKGMKLPADSQVIAVYLIDDNYDEIVIQHDSGLIKRFSLDQVNSKGRGGQGVGVGKTDDKYGLLSQAIVLRKEQNKLLFESSDQPSKIQDVLRKDIPEGKINTTAKKWKHPVVSGFFWAYED